MPSDIAFHNSWSFGRNTVIARIAITTSTPTRMAYSVVPWPLVDLANLFARTDAAAIARLEPSTAHANVLDQTPIPTTFSFPFDQVRARLNRNHQKPPATSSRTGPMTKSSIAGKMSVPVGSIIFTGALATRSSSAAR